MDRKTAIKIIENEIRCVQSDCDRDCGKCELVLPAEDIVTAMTMAVNALERELVAGDSSRENCGMEIKEVDENVEESVSRRMITDRLEEAYNDVLILEDDDDWNRGIKEGIYIAMTVINALPSAQPVVKRGKWIKRGGGALGYDCSCCGKSDVSNHFDFCPNCGADMRDQEGKG